MFRTLESQEDNLRLKPGKYLNKGQVVTQMFGKIKNCITTAYQQGVTFKKAQT